MIIFEGPDNAGKSTIADYVSNELGISKYHAGGPPASVKEMMGRVNFILKNARNFIFDRIPLISEPVYSILRGTNMFANSEDLYQQLRDLKPIIIYCRPPNDVLMDMKNHERKPYESESHVANVLAKQEMLIKRYDEVMTSDLLPGHWVYDYTTDSKEKLLGDIKNEMVRLGYPQTEKSRTAS